MLIFKIVPRPEWEAAGDIYAGSANDRADGFLHFSMAPQLPTTLRLYYAGQRDLLLISVDSDTVAADLKFEPAPSRGEDFPHLFAPLLRSTAKWVRPIGFDGAEFVLPPLD